MSDIEIGPYGVTQHADAAVVTANQLVGDRVGLTTGDAVAPGAGPALHSTAPYIPPKAKPVKAATPGRFGCYGKDGTCGAPVIQGKDYCFFHSPDYARERREPPATA